MMYFLLTVVPFAYVAFRFVWKLPYKDYVKLILLILLSLLGGKSGLYSYLGESFTSPELPKYFLLMMEWLYNGIIWLFILLLLRDIILVCLYVLEIFEIKIVLPTTRNIRQAALFILALTVSGVGIWQAAKVPDIRTEVITIPDLPRELDGMSIVQLSDLHCGPVLDKEWTEKIVNKINSIHPDLVVITGDIVDARAEQGIDYIRPLQNINAALGVFACTGAHEYFTDFSKWNPIFHSMGINMLNNESKVLTLNNAFARNYIKISCSSAASEG